MLRVMAKKWGHVEQKLPWAGLRVGRLWLDQGFGIELQPSLPPADEAVVVRFFLREFIFRDDAGSPYELLPHDHAGLVPAFSLLGAHVKRAIQTADLDLRIEFDTGASIEAFELEEGWELGTPAYGGSL